MTTIIFFKFTLLMLYWSSSVNVVAAIKCYNCGMEETNPCDNFNPNNSSFIVECPKKFSCVLETHGETKIRTCEDGQLDDCQKANNVEYCYCTGDLCNGNTIQFAPSDDEDYIEGSGIKTTTITPTTTIKPQVTVPKLANGQPEIARINILLLHLLFLLLYKR
ncbi:uncharacterized protein LOC123686140 [Harmonia axyridis]|uniref:uncharacterized protein LOC123686140 n=1 Tax=Harmonia axyridis TaxID=115357 RepID=UPI001E277715|nr:uncharacterized protein LOC123686140 [Harmonia axyridis]